MHTLVVKKSEMSKEINSFNSDVTYDDANNETSFIDDLDYLEYLARSAPYDLERFKKEDTRWNVVMH